MGAYRAAVVILAFAGCRTSDEENLTAGAVTLFRGPDFVERMSIAASRPRAVVVGDFNRDGALDFATATDHLNGPAVSVFSSIGGSYDRIDLEGPASRAISVADVNGDGFPDLVTAGSGKVSIYRNDRTGAFAAAENYGSYGGYSIVATDVDGDLKLDIVTIGGGTNGGVVAVLRNTGAGFEEADYPTGARPYAVLANDVDDDGIPDLVTANFEGNSISVLHGQGDGRFAAASEFPAVEGPHHLLATDVDQDGAIDLLVAGLNSFAVLNGTGRGSFLEPVAFAPLPSGLPWAMVALPEGTSILGTDANTSSLWLADPGQSIGPQAIGNSIPKVPLGLALGDMDGDGILDAVVGSYETAPTLY